jgi:hypothetical protein
MKSIGESLRMGPSYSVVGYPEEWAPISGLRRTAATVKVACAVGRTCLSGGRSCTWRSQIPSSTKLQRVFVENQSSSPEYNKVT